MTGLKKGCQAQVLTVRMECIVCTSILRNPFPKARIDRGSAVSIIAIAIAVAGVRSMLYKQAYLK